MAQITISDLKPNSFELLSDSKNDLMEISEEELGGIQGGFIVAPIAIIIAAAGLGN